MMDEAVKWSGRRRAYMVSDAALIAAGLRSEAFSSARRTPAAGTVAPVDDFLSRWPMYLEGERHDRARVVVRSTLAALDTSETRSQITSDIAERVSALAQLGRLDAVDELARPIAMEAVRRLFEIPADAFATLASTGREVVAFIGTGDPGPEQVAAANYAVCLLLAAVEALSEHDCPGLVALRTTAEALGMTDSDAMAIAVNLLIDGYEPIESVIATGVLRACRGLSTNTEAAIGDTTPFTYCGRFAAENTVIGSCPISKGERVLFLIGAVPQADPERHLAFGAGRHACPGAKFARFVVRDALAACERYLPGLSLEPTNAPRWRPSQGYRGLESLPVTRGDALNSAPRLDC